MEAEIKRDMGETAMRKPRDLGKCPLQAGEFPIEGDRDTSFLGMTPIGLNGGNGKWGMQSYAMMENEMTNKTGLVELIQTELRTFRASATVQGEPDFRELAVSLVRVFRDYIEAEILQLPDPNEQPSKGQGWE